MATLRLAPPAPRMEANSCDIAPRHWAANAHTDPSKWRWGETRQSRKLRAVRLRGLTQVLCASLHREAPPVHEEWVSGQTRLVLRTVRQPLAPPA